MGFFDKLKDGAAKAAEMAKDSVEIARLNTQISAKRKELERGYLKIGEAVFQAYQAQQPSDAESVVQEQSGLIVNCQYEIAQLELKIQAIKNEKRCSCGQVIPMDSKFCSACGQKFDPVPPQADAMGDVPPPPAPADPTYCSVCRAEVLGTDRFCESCGNELTKEAAGLS
ncbi:zinc ribbon domain-containing protein [Cohnella sp. REN36]|uniref:zinc ribbon domain-containing protein n=1 Tax=Cohnella sp. REN36 TaxID=2887347 RepID=UPI001D1430A2|nr:zinc ribbon domain-containing protein [Cohnella sp. REN36]MCC3375451.1 zinc ribbon domain-containing protein [Cohnella sp. REN36]